MDWILFINILMYWISLIVDKAITLALYSCLDIPESFRSLVGQMCNVDSTKRPGLHELMKHEFFQSSFEQIPLALKLASAVASPINSNRPTLAYKEDRILDVSIRPTQTPLTQETILGSSRYEADFEGRFCCKI